MADWAGMEQAGWASSGGPAGVGWAGNWARENGPGGSGSDARADGQLERVGRLHSHGSWAWRVWAWLGLQLGLWLGHGLAGSWASPASKITFFFSSFISFHFLFFTSKYQLSFKIKYKLNYN